MKKISTYIPSVIISVLMIFCFLGGAAALIADININPDKTVKFAEEEKIDDKVMASIDKYYREKANSTGIPATVFTDSISREYVREQIRIYIDSTYDVLEDGGKFSAEPSKNEELEAAIDKFFNDYADDTNYEKDAEFEKKLENTKKNAYKTIGGYCDIFKVSSMESHGLLKKLSKLYSRRYPLTIALSAFGTALIVLLFIIHRRNRKEILYWCGISAVIAGIMGAFPCLYLISTKYYDSFSIKQPQVFAAYTKSLYALTEAYTAACIAIAVIGICMIVIYGVLSGKKQKASEVLPITKE